MKVIDGGREITVAESRKVHCEEYLPLLFNELKKFKFPFEIVIRPIDKNASHAQNSLWAVWMVQLEEEMGAPRRKIETELLTHLAPRHFYEGPDGPTSRVKEFAELTVEQASAVLRDTQINMAQAGYELVSRKT